MQVKTEQPSIIEGGLAVDDRGEVGFANGFDMTTVKRFYTVQNHKVGFIRAWHGHKNEEKYFTIVQGAAIVAAVEIDNWETPSRETNIQRFVLSAKKNNVFYIPAGYANGFKTLTEDTKLMVFSTSTLDESLNDDFRYDAYYWNPWDIVER